MALTHDLTDPQARVVWLSSVVRDHTHANCRPQDAASLIIVDRSRTEPRVLMGRRHKAQKFLPQKYVFPGGRVAIGDTRVQVPQTLHRKTERKLLVGMKGRVSAARARGLGLAAIRETFEETGLVIGSPVSNDTGAPIATQSSAWRAFAATAVVPGLEHLRYVARAVTPPQRPRRYDTRFFAIDAEAVAPLEGDQDGELSDVSWLTLEEALEADIPPITAVILYELADYLHQEPELRGQHKVPHYQMLHRRFTRTLL